MESPPGWPFGLPAMLSALIAGITHLRKIWRIAGRLQCLRIHMGVRLQLRAQDTMSS